MNVGDSEILSAFQFTTLMGMGLHAVLFIFYLEDSGFISVPAQALGLNSSAANTVLLE
jgi:hypothetical protein